MKRPESRSFFEVCWEKNGTMTRHYGSYGNTVVTSCEKTSWRVATCDMCTFSLDGLGTSHFVFCLSSSLFCRCASAMMSHYVLELKHSILVYT